ncbi:MAG: dimethylhistidine N-methyltransferase [Saprospiraceae bacterium]|nr:MAG: dimethylhistidine N-methyltransferase [Saprospiraceae bacterium]
MNKTNSTNVAIDRDFATHVANGLSANPKKISSRYFYDDQGDKLFQRIMNMPEYYLTNSEMEIFQNQKDAILKAVNGQPFDLIELGAGDGTKTMVLLRHFLKAGSKFRYCPVDISEHVLEELGAKLAKELPELEVDPLPGEYFEVLRQLDSSVSKRPRVIFFLGANIGNFPKLDAKRFLKQLRGLLQPGDQLLIGIDLKKDPAIILNAYNDPAGITAAFNLNLLHRINRDLGGNFAVNQFKHWETYNPLNGETRSAIVSKIEQKVHIEAIDQSFHFNAWEAIDVELSLKYDRQEIALMAAEVGFRVKAEFVDKQEYFVDSLWVV